MAVCAKIKIHVVAIHENPDTAQCMHSIKKEYGRHLSFWGRISTQRLLPFGTTDEIKAKTAEIIRVMGRGDGYIAAPTHAIPGDVPSENVLAMLEVMKDQHRYL
jgi:uroporphyrinogen decarboxylase